MPKRKSLKRSKKKSLKRLRKKSLKRSKRKSPKRLRKKSLEKVPEYKQKHYYIHDNGGRPFLVYINKNIVTVYTYDEKQIDDLNDFYNDPDPRLYYNKKLLTKKAEKVFIGKSKKNKMTEYSGAYGPEFDGNSILLLVSDNSYIYIGNSIFEFKTKDPVISFHSPIGNSDVPYPFCVLKNGDIYLMIESVIVENLDKKKYESPYDYYYECKNEKNCGKFKSFRTKKIVGRK